jgi:hypothetical protein
MMKRTQVNGVLVLSILFIVLASFHYETNEPTRSFLYDGAHSGIGILAIIGIVLLFKLTSLWADILANRERIARRPSFPFDWLILAAMLTNMIGYRASGEWFTGVEGKQVPSWLFDYGNCELKGEFVLSVIAIALLLRVYAIAKALLAATQSREL